MPKPKSNRENMRITSVNFRKTDLELLEQIIEAEGYPSRSEALRDMISDWVRWKMELIENKKLLIDVLREYNNRKKLDYKEEDNIVSKIVNEQIIDGMNVRQLEDIKIPNNVYKAMIERGEIKDGIIK